MKILFATGIYPPDVGGPATYTRAMARAFASQDHEVSVVCYADAVNGERGTVNGDDTFEVYRVSRSLLLLFRYIAFAWKVFRAAKKVDLVYLQGPVSEGFPGTIGAMLAGKPTVMKVVGDYAWEIYMQEPGDGNKVLLDEFVQADVGARPRRAHRKSIKISLIDKIERWTAKQAKKIITPSCYLKTIVEQWGVPGKKIEVIYNSNEELPKSDRSRDELRKDFNVDKNIVLLTAVRSVPWKGVAELISWWNDLPRSHILVIAGDGPELDKWRQIAVNKKVTDRVFFLGRLDRKILANWMDVADAFVLNSGYEGFPHVISEAASAMLPSYLSNSGGNREVLDVFTNTWLFTFLKYNDKESWISKLSRVQKRSMSGRNPMTWTFKRVADKTLSVLKIKTP